MDISPGFAMKHVEIIQGDALSTLRAMPAGTVDCCVTSPPYWGLRDYGTAGQIGLEVSPDAWCARLVEVFMEVHRVLAPAGTLWINLGDAYIGSGRGPDVMSGLQGGRRGQAESRKVKAPQRPAGYKRKDLVGLPWMLAFALRKAGWWLRSDVIWEKPNIMPESCKDRPTKNHEYVFLFTKSERYYFNQRAIMEPTSPDSHARYARGRSDKHKWSDGGPTGQTIATTFAHMIPRPARFTRGPGDHGHVPAHTRLGVHHHGAPKANGSFSAAVKDPVHLRNSRTVWRIPTQPRHEAHFASFPDELARRCILAGCPEGGLVLDPFAGRGTTLIVARELRRRAVGIELNPEYVEMTRSNLARSAS